MTTTTASVSAFRTTSSVTAVPAAEPAVAHAHFARRLAVETDVADVAEALAAGEPDFVLLDARSEQAYADGHVPGAISLPHARITADTVAALPDGLVVAYCWGPSCNGATKAAARLAALGRPVKEMLGGFEYWRRERHPVERPTPAPR
jgi:rhodanese-related sulfurtransferase